MWRVNKRPSMSYILYYCMYFFWAFATVFCHEVKNLLAWHIKQKLQNTFLRGLGKIMDPERELWREAYMNLVGTCHCGRGQQTCMPCFGLHDDSANDNSANDKMAARFSHTDDSATFLFEKKAKMFFPTPHG